MPRMLESQKKNAGDHAVRLPAYAFQRGHRTCGLQ
jgi:hypothetical protein